MRGKDRWRWVLVGVGILALLAIIAVAVLEFVLPTRVEFIPWPGTR